MTQPSLAFVFLQRQGLSRSGKGLAEKREPHLFMLSLHVSLQSRRRTLAESGRTGGVSRRTTTEINVVV